MHPFPCSEPLNINRRQFLTSVTIITLQLCNDVLHYGPNFKLNNKITDADRRRKKIFPIKTSNSDK